MAHPAVEKIEAGDPLLDKFRSLFPDKSPTVLSNIFGEMTDSVYKGKGEKEAGKMSNAMKSRWGSIAAKFRSLNLIEFKIAMYRFKTQQLTFEEIRRIFLWLDSSGNGRVEYDEFVAGVRGDLSLMRQRICVFIFRKLDRNSSGFIEESELVTHLRHANIPEVLDGSMTPQAKAKELIALMGTPANGTITPEGKISVEQLVDYYLTQTLQVVMTDDEFKYMVIADWGMEASDSTNMPGTRENSMHGSKTPAVPQPTAPATPPPAKEASPRGKAVAQASTGKNGKDSSVAASSEVDKKALGEQYRQQYTNLASPARRDSVDGPSDVGALVAQLQQMQAKVADQDKIIESQSQMITAQAQMIATMQAMMTQQLQKKA